IGGPVNLDGIPRLVNLEDNPVSTSLPLDGIRAGTISQDGRLYAVATVHDVVVSDVQTPKQIFIHASGVTKMSFSTDDTRLLTMSRDRVTVWDAHTGQAVGAIWKQRSTSFQDAKFTGDGVGIVAIVDHTAAIWDARARQAVGLPFTSDNLTHATFTADGKRVL